MLKKVCFVCAGENKREFERLYQKISENDDSFAFYESVLELLKALTLAQIFPDLILLEYKSYRNFGEVMYGILKSQGIKIPLVMVGSSCQCRSSAARWVSENEYVFDIQLSCQMIAVLEKIAKCIKEDNIFDEPSDRVPFKNMLPLKSPCLPPVENKLLSYFYENQNREISVEEIGNQLDVKSESKIMRKNVVYSYISRLRKNFCKKPGSQVEIVRLRKGFYQLVILGREE